VELIVTVTAIGLVAAVALPRFGSQQREQRVAKLNMTRGAVQSAAALLHGVARARHNEPQEPCAGIGFGANPPLVNTAGNGNLCTENGRVQVALLYPAPTLAGIVAGAGLVPVPGTPSGAQLAHEGYEVVAAAGTLEVRLRGGSDPAQCSFVYRAPSALGTPPVISSAVTAGC
jgi:MSHA pilin protein MshA